MASKIDLEKAYDRFRWDFLEDTLIEVVLSRLFIQVIMHCVTSTSLQALWNGNLTDEFQSSHGLRQGDPLSLYLFVLYMKRLSHLIDEAIT